MILRIATRRSKLALAQAHWVKASLEALEPGLTVELREYVTRGDQIQNVPLPEVGGKGLFTKEIEDALLAGEADLAVHSLKDLPSELPPGLLLAAVPEREDPRDALVLPPAEVRSQVGTLETLGRGSRIGSSSLRRSAQVLHARPDLEVASVRGNVDTRLRKLDEGQYHALILACAGLRRLGLSERISAAMPVELCTPAPGQGALGLEARAEDSDARELLARLEHKETRAAVTAERALMEHLGGGCSIPLGAYGRIEAGRLRLLGMVALPDGSRLVRVHVTGDLSEPEVLGRTGAAELIAGGAREILDQVRSLGG
jgi:hydroxymethylbilane synthase